MMTFVPDEPLLARPRNTIHAAELFHSQAGVIAQICARASKGDAVVAAVDRFLSFSGVWTVQSSRLIEAASEWDQAGWTLLFSPGTDLREIERRSLDLGRQAFRRWEVLRRWASKHRADTAE